MLWLLTYDDDYCTLLRILKECNTIFINLWIPQILNILIEKNELFIEEIVLKVIIKINKKIKQLL